MGLLWNWLTVQAYLGHIRACDEGQWRCFLVAAGHFQIDTVKGIWSKIVGAGNENRTRVLNLGSGCTREINVQFIPDQGSYFFDIELTEFIAGTPWALLVIQTHR